tara:strand:- start:987 stop:1859 length:873 start_codon:yes stop_codon:yes gene_type:complete
MAACVAGQVTEATIELGCYPPLASSWERSGSQVDLWGPGVPKFMKSSTYEWDDMATIADLCEEVGFLGGKGPAYEAEEEAHRKIRDFELLAGLNNDQDLSDFVETHNFIEDAEHAAALDQWLSGDEHGLEPSDDTTLLESHFGEEAHHVAFGEEVDKGAMLLKKMGWTEGPLGCRGSGITEPIKATGGNDTMGLGYQGEEFLFPHEGEEITDSMKLTRMGANYGVGTCSRGTVFIPRGALKHIENICDQKSSRESPVGETFVCELVAGQGKHPWRLKKVLKIEMTWSAIE